MRTNPPGEVRDEGEGKNPMVVGEPGGLEEESTEETDLKQQPNDMKTFSQ